ncbi:hypothetical protein [Streptomyces roseochromogenus]|uniref:TetR family transcriptional regulator n=1 Tax=Streptomyces roseochromogenus subsp. oscitans DS 12.976 TaxID=1352936 RepID=V6KHH7_STRRC|nr:hypothetical protein [Streptomyces roseochromogenus]EST31493.1 hypothetical protein M878_16625 [Streptomyces roseochromogenus subsp. oscitans DS 12.976]
MRADLTATGLVPLMCGVAYAANVHGAPAAARAETARRSLAALLEGLYVRQGPNTSQGLPDPGRTA